MPELRWRAGSEGSNREFWRIVSPDDTSYSGTGMGVVPYAPTASLLA